MKQKYLKPDLDTSISTKYDYSEKTYEVNEKLPIFPSYSVIVAPPKSGKTLMAMNLLRMVKMYLKNKLLFLLEITAKPLGKM